jgi:hypothetical protein
MRGNGSSAAFAGDLSSCLSTDLAAFPEDAVLQLLGRAPAELPGGRLALYVCPECGDLACGAVTVSMESTRDDVVWRDPGHQSTAEPDKYFELFEGLGPFRFARSQYEAALVPLLDDPSV